MLPDDINDLLTKLPPGNEATVAAVRDYVAKLWADRTTLMQHINDLEEKVAKHEGRHHHHHHHHHHHPYS